MTEPTKPPYRGTRLRSFRIPDAVYDPARETAQRREESLTDVVVAALERYERKHRREVPWQEKEKT